MKNWLRSTAVILISVPMLACSKPFQDDPGSVGANPQALISSKTPAEGSGDDRAKLQASSLDCGSRMPGPPMVAVTTPSGDSYCIDTTEVTQAQYALFLASTDQAPGTEHPSCAWNRSYMPFIGDDTTPGRCVPPDGMGADYFYSPNATANRPVSCVDWCDAQAFCVWAGKRLCGRVGGGSTPLASHGDPKSSQWFNACSNGGATVYTYGDAFEPGKCPRPKQMDALHSNVDNTGGAPECHGLVGALSQVRDLGGGVFEWLDTCEDLGSGTVCGVSGGVNESPEAMRCDFVGTMSPRNSGNGVGFRCCRD